MTTKMNYMKIPEDRVCNIIRKSNKAFEVVMDIDGESRVNVRYHLNVDVNRFCVVLEVFIHNTIMEKRQFTTIEEVEELADFWNSLINLHFRISCDEKEKHTEKVKAIAEAIFDEAGAIFAD